MAAELTMKVVHINPDDIDQTENSRSVYKTVDLSELMHSMRKHGLLQPIGVMPIPGKKGKYETVYGNRRLIAAKKLGWSEIPAVITSSENETDRDILNLVENIKRQNTTVAEDGRMFLILRDRGLTDDEIAARLDISKQRVETAIEVYKKVPEDIRGKIVNRVSGKKEKGKISASAAHTILNLKKRHGLNRKQFRSLLNYAGTDKASIQHIHAVAPLLKKGASVEQALDIVGDMERITLTVFIHSSRREKLEKKYKKSYAELCYQQIQKNTELKAERAPKKEYNPTASQHKNSSILRKAKMEEEATA